MEVEEMIFKKRILGLIFFMLICWTLTINGQTAVKMVITGRVISEMLQPLSGVDVIANQPGIMGKTNADGQYVLQVFERSNLNNATCCTVSFRLNGYQSITRAVDLGSQRLDVVLLAENKWAPERCTPSMSRARVGWTMKLLAPKGAIIEEKDDGNAHLYFRIGIGAEDNRDWITMFFAPLNVGCVIDNKRLHSSNYLERDVLLPGGCDFHGRDSNGKKWRNTGFGNESITYENVSDKTAVYFDKIIDSMCIDVEKTRPSGILDHYKK
jgi:hypothetical protein